MNLTDWIDQPGGLGGSEPWARRTAGEATKELAPGEDPVVFGSLAYANADRPRHQVTLWAAATFGLVKVTVETDPMGSLDATITLSVDSWPALGSNLRLDSTGDPEDRRRAVAMLIGPHQIQSTKYDGDALVAFFRECGRRVSSVSP